MNASNAQHLRLMEERLKSLTPGTKAHTKILNEVKRIKSEQSGAGARRRASSYGSSGRHYTNTGAGYRGGNARTGYNYNSNFNSSYKSTFADAIKNIDKGTRYSQNGYVAGIVGGTLAMSAASQSMRAEAKRGTSNTVNLNKRDVRGRRAQQAGIAGGGAGLGFAVGSAMAHRTMMTGNFKQGVFMMGAGAAVGGAGAYAAARKMSPTSNKGPRVVYYKMNKENQHIRHSRKNPSYKKGV